MPTKNKFLNINAFLLLGLSLSVSIMTFYPSIAKKILVLTAILWLFKFIKKEQLLNLYNIKPFKFILISFIYMLFSFFWAIDYHDYHGYVFNQFFYFFLPILLFATIPNKKQIQMLVSLFLGVMFLNELISYGILFGLWLNMDSGYPVYFLNHTYYSVLIVISILLTYYRLLHSEKLYLKFIYLFFTITMIGNLIISGGRNGQVVLLLSIFILTIIAKNTSFKKIFFSLFLPIFLFFIAYMVSPQFKQRTNCIISDTEKVFYNQDFSTSFGKRLFSYILLNDNLKENKILIGTGAGSTQSTKNMLVDKYHKSGDIYDVKKYTHFHQFYINTFVNFGFIGLFLLLLFYFFFFKLKIKDNEIEHIKNSVLFTMIFSNLADGMSQERPVMIVFSLFIGLIFAQYIQENLKVKQ